MAIPCFSTLIIGCGAIAGGYDAADVTGPNILAHAKAFNTHDGFDLVACADRDPGIARDFADLWQVDRAYDDLEDALNDREYDIISVCTSTPSHEPILRRLQGTSAKLILCEKPITDNIVTAREMADLYGGRMAVNYLRRFDPEIRRLAAAIRAGQYGSFVSAKAIYNKGLYNNGSHMTDLLHMLIGPLRVIESGAVTHDFWPDDPTLSARLESQSKAPITLTGTDVRHGMTFDLSLDFEQAEISLTDYSQTLTIRTAAGAEKIEADLNRGMYNAVANIHDHLTNRTPLYSTAENAVPALEVCHEIRRLAGL
ncbi:MAG: Gfo/Idh/MocA family oxidoreductase [Alphaproteobacteria bacterium]|nr:Gfo/Idh/MocA family oxidoreductase [Alphaproteobacteria bacterium]